LNLKNENIFLIM